MVIKSLYPDIVLPDVDIFSFIFSVKDRPFSEDKEIFIDSETQDSYTTAKLRTTAIEFGKGLQSRWGFRKGDVLAIFSPNSIDYPPILWGAIWAGCVVSPANPTYTAKELAFQLKDAKAKGLATQLALLPTALEAAKLAGIPENRVVLFGRERGSGTAASIKHFSELRGGPGFLSRPSRPRINSAKDNAFIVYSSGTTGLPKGVPLTHDNVIANVMQTVVIERYSGLHHNGGQDGKGDKQLAVLPFYHVYGLVVLVHKTIHLGLQAVLLNKFDLERACKLIQDYGITFMYVPPPIVLGLAKHPVVAEYDLSSLKWINSGAAPLTQELIEAVWDRLTVPVKQGYGLSEASPTAMVQNVLQWAKCKGSVGCLFPSMECKIVGVDGNEVADEKEGEIWLKGPNVFHGYLGRPDLAEETFSSCGYLKTGDIGFVDPKGNFYITDRLKELIKYKGFQVAPAELEGALHAHPEVGDACVIPAFDRARETEVPRAYIVLKTGTPQSEEKAREIVEWLAARVAPHKQLRGGVRFVDVVPKSPSGKILRKVLKEQAKKEDLATKAKL